MVSFFWVATGIPIVSSFGTRVGTENLKTVVPTDRNRNWTTCLHVMALFKVGDIVYASNMMIFFSFLSCNYSITNLILSGLMITCIMAVMIACRLRVVRRRTRKGGKGYAHDADYLVNGMYLWMTNFNQCVMEINRLDVCESLFYTKP